MTGRLGFPKMVAHASTVGRLAHAGRPDAFDGGLKGCRIRPFAAFLVALLALAIQAAPASALVYVMPTDESMVDRSPIIVFGEVRVAGLTPADGSLSTDYFLAVEEVLKGEVGANGILVRQPGGVGADGKGMIVAGLPMLKEGDRVLLFLRQEEDGAHQIVDYSLGMFWEVRNGDRSFLLREPSLNTVKPRRDEFDVAESSRGRLPRDADRLRRWISDRVAGVERPADYFEPQLPEGPVAIEAPFRLFRVPALCRKTGLPIRWEEFDLGNAVGLTVDSGGQDGIPGSRGTAELGAAMDSWNGDPHSVVNLTVSGFGSPASDQDEGNWVVYEDPFREIDGSYTAEDGTLALSRVFYDCNLVRAPATHFTQGRPPMEALGITRTRVITQDGYAEHFLGQHVSAAGDHEYVMTHELGHSLGLDHSCNDEDGPACDNQIPYPLMAGGHASTGSDLASDDQAGLRYLYPLENASAELCFYGDCTLWGGRFRVEAEFNPHAVDSEIQMEAFAQYLGNSAGLFHRLEDTPELLVRIVNSCRAVGYWEVHAGALWEERPSNARAYYVVTLRDLETGSTRSFEAQHGQPIAEPRAFRCVQGDDDLERGAAANPGERPTCSGSTCSLQDGAFRVKAYYNPNINPGDGSRPAGAVAASIGEASGLFSFGGSEPTLLVSVVDQCGEEKAGHWEVRAGAAWSGDYSVAVRNVSTGELKWFYSEDGHAVVDTTAFACESAGGTSAPDLVVESPGSTESSVTPGGTFRFAATVRNQGEDRSDATTLRYYRSTDSRITTSDTAVGTDRIGALSVSATDRQSIGQRAPSTPGTYYYGACVDPVSGESNTANNCSTGVRVTVVSDPGGATGEGFDLDGDNRSALGLTYANGRFYVVDLSDEKVYAYGRNGARAASRDFNLISSNGYPAGITYGDNRFFVVDRDEDKVFAYSSGGHRVSSDDFGLDSANARPDGIAYAGGRVYVLDNGADKVYVYARGGGRLSSRDFDLDSSNTSARGITYADGRFYVVDSSDEKVYVYDATNGAHVPSAEFDLESDNSDPQGITHADGRLFVLDVDEDRVFAYRAGGGAGPDLVVESPRSTESTVAPRGAFRFAATVINRGQSRSGVTTLRYYRSSDSRITTSDTAVGTDPVGGLSGSGSAQTRPSIGLRAPTTPGTYYYGACVDPVSGESNTANNCSSGVRVTVTGDGPAEAPDLVVESPRSTESSAAPGGTFRFAATVRNQGEDRSAATTLRYYRSSDSRITTSDTAVGTDRIGALSVSATDRQSIGQRAPSTPGTYYYGACVDPVSGESNTANNCSSGVRLTVTGDGPADAPDLVVESPRSTESSVAPGGTFRFAATVRNQGEDRSAATTLRYYRSADSRITTSDTAVGTDRIGALSVSATDRQSIGQRAPSTPGTYYYGACVDPVSGESNTANNCSSGVRVTVTGDDTGEALASYRQFRVIDHNLSESQNHSAECTRRLGPGVRLADWNDIVAYDRGGGSLAAFADGLKMSVEGGSARPGDIASGYRISRDGNPIYSGNRHYFVARHNHNRPGYFLAHAQLDNHYLSLGSWYGTGGYMLCYAASSTGGGVAKIYWGDPGARRISRSDPDGTNVERVLTADGQVYGLALDAAAGKMYFGNHSRNKVQRANLDGSGVEDFVTGIRQPEGVAIDANAAKVYFGGELGVYRVDMNGANVVHLVSGARVEALVLDLAGGKMYWPDRGASDRIRRANLDGTGVEDVVTGLGHVEGIALHSRQRKVYWSDVTRDRIQRANLDGTGVEDVVTGQPAPQGLAIDENQGVIYWGDTETDRIRRASLDGTGVRDLVSRAGDPQALALLYGETSGDGAALASYRQFRVIDHDLDEFQDHSAECTRRLGSGVRLADWNDIVDYYRGGGSLATFASELKMSVTDQPRRPGELASGYRISRDGREIHSGRRHYYVGHSGNPSHYHAHLENQKLWLGSWWGTGGYALCYAVTRGSP